MNYYYMFDIFNILFQVSLLSDLLLLSIIGLTSLGCLIHHSPSQMCAIEVWVLVVVFQDYAHKVCTKNALYKSSHYQTLKIKSY